MLNKIHKGFTLIELMIAGHHRYLGRDRHPGVSGLHQPRESHGRPNRADSGKRAVAGITIRRHLKAQCFSMSWTPFHHTVQYVQTMTVGEWGWKLRKDHHDHLPRDGDPRIWRRVETLCCFSPYIAGTALVICRKLVGNMTGPARHGNKTTATAAVDGATPAPVPTKYFPSHCNSDDQVRGKIPRAQAPEALPMRVFFIWASTGRDPSDAFSCDRSHERCGANVRLSTYDFTLAPLLRDSSRSNAWV